MNNWCFTLVRHADIPLRVDACVTLLPPEVAAARAFYWNIRPVETLSE